MLDFYYSQAMEISLRPMHFLPEEILLHVFSFLPVASLATCETVCRHWRRLAMDDSLWKALAFKILGKSCTREELIERLRERAEIKKLYPQRLIEAFGGMKEFQQFPVLQLSPSVMYSAFGVFSSAATIEEAVIAAQDMIAPIMRGIDCQGTAFLVIRYYCLSTQRTSIQAFYMRYQEEVCALRKQSNDSPLLVLKSSLDEEDFQYLSRLFQRQPCGIRDEHSEGPTTATGESAIYLI